ncbi:hypothetical protein I4U23_030451 [Adineta vaga]|nr:hypothetical protein I4U23_030451 [Adineta vaga]
MTKGNPCDKFDEEFAFHDIKVDFSTIWVDYQSPQLNRHRLLRLNRRRLPRLIHYQCSYS